MVHPYTEPKLVNKTVGLGVFATTDIPAGTIINIKDRLDIIITPDNDLLDDPNYKDQIDAFAQIDQYGTRIIPWDHAKYINHCCESNALTTAYGFDITIKPIKAGEEITVEYGIYNLENDMPISCNCKDCRKVVRPEDFDLMYPLWDNKIISVLGQIFEQDQPLLKFVKHRTIKELREFILNKRKYKSVYTLRYNNLINDLAVV